MKITSGVWRDLALPVCFAAMLSLGSAAELNPAALVYKMPDQFPGGRSMRPARRVPSWSAIPTSPASTWSTTNGPRATISAARTSIPTTATSSCCRAPGGSASGPKFDPEHGTVPMPAGSFVTHYGKQVHWDGAKDEDAVLLIMGEGPATSTLVPEEK